MKSIKEYLLEEEFPLNDSDVLIAYLKDYGQTAFNVNMLIHDYAQQYAKIVAEQILDQASKIVSNRLSIKSCPCAFDADKLKQDILNIEIKLP